MHALVRCLHTHTASRRRSRRLPQERFRRRSMSNVTTVRPIEPYLPSCSGFTVQDFRNEFESRGTAFNLSNTGKYVYDVRGLWCTAFVLVMPSCRPAAWPVLAFVFCLRVCCAWTADEPSLTS